MSGGNKDVRFDMTSDCSAQLWNGFARKTTDSLWNVFKATYVKRPVAAFGSVQVLIVYQVWEHKPMLGSGDVLSVVDGQKAKPPSH